MIFHFLKKILMSYISLIDCTKERRFLDILSIGIMAKKKKLNTFQPGSVVAKHLGL